MDEARESIIQEEQAWTGSVRFRMISSRICGPDDQLAVRRFVCCGAGAPEYAMDVQRYIRGLDLKENADDVLRMALYCEGDSDVLAFCEFGWIGSSDAYAISYIATALSEQCNGLGGMLLATVLRWVGNDSAVTGRDPYIMTQINPDNHASMRLFKAYGFSDEGADEDDPEYHIWSRNVERFRTDKLWLSQLTQVTE